MPTGNVRTAVRSPAVNVPRTWMDGTVVHWDGGHWSEESSDTNETLWAVWGSDANNVWAVGFNGAILVRH